MIDWLLKHPVVIFVIIMGASSLIKHLTASGKAPPVSSGSEPSGGDADTDDAERVRRLQAEIRRKIAERRGRPAMPPPVPVQEPVFPAPSWVEPEEQPSPYRMPEPQPLVQTVTPDPVLERQRELAEQLAVLNARRADIEKASQTALRPSEAEGAAVVNQTADAGWIRELRGARSLRKAVILREVIGPPVALR